MNSIMEKIKDFTGYILKALYGFSTSKLFETFRNKKKGLYNRCIKNAFASCGKDCSFGKFTKLSGAKYAHLGDKVSMGQGVVIEIYDRYKEQRFNPNLTNGNNSSFGDLGHITFINHLFLIYFLL